jgi:hypothetical protein
MITNALAVNSSLTAPAFSTTNLVANYIQTNTLAVKQVSSFNATFSTINMSTLNGGNIALNNSNEITLYDSSINGWYFSNYCYTGLYPDPPVDNVSPETISHYMIYSYQGNKYFYLSAYNTTGVGSINSDLRLKKEIVPLSSVLSSLLQLNPVQFKFNTMTSHDKPCIGFIAQEYEKVFPNDVSVDPVGYKTLQLGGLFPYLVKGLQEQQAEITVRVTGIH